MNFKENESATKLRGGYYTRPEIASFLLRWVAEIGPRHLLEPSCGDGVFFAELARLQSAGLDVAGVAGLEIVGFEIEEGEAGRAREAARGCRAAAATVHARDFLSWALDRFAGAGPLQTTPPFDAVVGNPPFIRYQYLTAGQQATAEALFRHFGLPFTRHTNAWVPFVVAAVALLRPGGRLAMVLPAELLHVLHAQSLRSFLTASCSRVLIFDPQEIWFEDTLQGAILVLAERKGEDGHGRDNEHGVAIRPTRSREFLRDDPGSFFRTADYANGATVAGKWMPALLSRRERELLAGAAELPGVRRFGELADVDIGIVTGANKFFLVSDETVERHGLAPWAHPMFGRSVHVPGVIYDEATHGENRRAGFPGNFLWFTGETAADLPAPVRAYLASGEAEGLAGRYKCRIRRPWYSVPSVYATPVGMLKRSHHFPRLILNRLEAFTTDTSYRIRPQGGEPADLVVSFVNSLTALCAELEGRHYGGGVLELVPSEIEKLLLPLVAAGEEEIERLDEAVRSGVPPEEVLRRQDEVTLARLGLSPAEACELRAAGARLRSRRQRDGDEGGESASPDQCLAD